MSRSSLLSFVLLLLHGCRDVYSFSHTTTTSLHHLPRTSIHHLHPRYTTKLQAMSEEDEAELKRVQEESRMKVLTDRRKSIRGILKAAESSKNFRLQNGEECFCNCVHIARYQFLYRFVSYTTYTDTLYPLLFLLLLQGTSPN